MFEKIIDFIGVFYYNYELQSH